ncbi:hypothetical protein [Enterovibrio nigricans]|uniref:Uncharacterized protein n=1 Tax=Enterovibrio nigricans DSM 22720 TaxID=1121868 RepID=A0A1T4UV91_9GAMM|nr:hypothetical protein [Enterovibrio nigricans]PKF50903.1 hypothetical protein AT251_07735 [Enterovibrio nigricans]SKA56556.1 hypothetical protein SAMN02745132_02582 [Enterovibrio nigricans DSM 22720]
MTKNTLGCDYKGYEFGAHYLDSTCIDGYLWDMDSGGTDEHGDHYLDSGGDIPCPQCNAKKHIKSYLSDYLNSEGYVSLVLPLTTKKIKNVLRKWPSNRRRMAMRYLRSGRREAIKEAKLEG